MSLTTVGIPINLAAWAQLADDELIKLIREGEIALYEILMRRYNQRIYRVVRAILRNDTEAEDVMQEAYVRAYQHLNDFAGEAKFSTWLTKIAIHEAIARVRRFTRIGERDSPAYTPDLENTMRSNERDPETQAYDRELGSILENAIDALPDAYRCVFILRVVEGLSTDETAAALEIGVETVKIRLHRGRAMLTEKLKRRAGIVASRVFPFHAPRCDRVVAAVLQRILIS